MVIFSRQRNIVLRARQAPRTSGSRETSMRFLIIGAGALGGYYGGMLLKGGADVTFLVRPRRAAQLAERGLIVKNADGELVTGVRTVQAGDIGGPYDVVFLTCKAYDLDKRSTSSCRPWRRMLPCCQS